MNEIKSISVKQALLQQSKGDVILDVRTLEEWSEGIPRSALLLSLSDIQQGKLDSLNVSDRYLLICRSGQRSQMACSELLKRGYANVVNIEKGFNEWKRLALPVEIPQISDQELRYQRHYQLQGFGVNAQKKLLNSHVLIIGLGGLGSASAYYLAAAGVGQITLIDDDKVSLGNLQRQILHSSKNLNQEKVISAKQKLSDLNPEITIETVHSKLNADNAEQLIANVDLVIDGSDNLETRYLVNDTCSKYKKKLVYAAVYEFEAQLTSFDFARQASPCLRCLFPQTQGFEPANCSSVGVLGVIPGLAGIIQASEAIKLLTEVGETLLNQLQVINLFDNSFSCFHYKTDPNCKNQH